MTYIEVGTESSEDNRSFLLVREEQHFRLARIVCFEHIVVRLRNVNNSVSNVLESHLLEFVCVKSVLGVDVIDDWNRVGRVDLVRWILSNTFLVANLGPLGAFN